MKKEIICISCPLGCYLTVNFDQKILKNITGNRCILGVDYAKKEILNPERTLTTTVRVNNGNLPLVSVKTNKPLPKNKIFDTMNLLAKIQLEAPVKIGEKIIQNIFNTKIDIIATKNIIKKGNL